MTTWIRTHKETILKGLGSLLALSSLFFLFQQQSWDEVLSASKEITWTNFIIATGFLLLSRFFVSARWHILLRSGGIEISFWQTTSLTFTGLFASNFLPTTVGGDIVRVGGAIQLGYNRVISTASIIVDRLVGMFGMALLLPFAFLSLETWYSETEKIAFSAVFINKFGGKISRILKKLIEAFQIWLKKPSALFLSLFFSLGHMLCLFSSLLVISQGLGESISFGKLGIIWSLAYFITLLPISINGYGMQELSLTYFLSNLGGMTLANSLVLAIIIRVVFVIASLPGVLFLPKILTNMNKK